MKVSIIIPVYNAECFLERCLDSVLSQTLSDIEVICIDDCSTDNSFKILNKYVQKDSRVKCFRNEKNIGQGLTRNIGLGIARGEYVAFVDCDDWIESDMYDVLYSKTNIQKYDLICCNLIYDFPTGISEAPKMPKTELITLKFLIEEAIAPKIRLFSPNSPCDKIYRRAYLEKLNLRFESERVFMYEDKFFNLAFLVSNPSFCFVPTVFYHYVIRYGSTMTSYRKEFKNRYFVMNNKIKNLFLENNFITEELELRFRQSLFEITFSFCLNALVYNKSFKGKLSEFWSLINDKRISVNTKYFSYKDIPVSSSKMNKLVKLICFFTLKYLRS
jgi:glycosyltransferase involved in cell wall biosynthesis